VPDRGGLLHCPFAVPTLLFAGLQLFGKLGRLETLTERALT